MGVEALGFKGPDVDCEIILMLKHLWQILGLSGVELQINCLGNKDERLAHREALIAYFEQHQELLDEEAKRRLHTNPLRILDTKNSAMQELVGNAPKLLAYLGEHSQAHYTGWKAGLDALNIAYVENPRLVRGLDYYNLSVFEWVSSDLGSQSTVCGGGRYDPLVAELSGKENYAIGFAIGLERLLLSLEAQNKLIIKPDCDIYIVNDGVGAAEVAFSLAQELRTLGYKVIQHLGGGSFKSQFKKADSSGARLSLVIGENEVKLNQVVLKLMAEQKQELIEHTQLSQYVTNFFNS